VARPDVSLCGQPMANIMDYSLGVNIAPFGLCGSLLNPQVASATAMNNGVLQRMPCAPQIPLPWAGGEKDVSVNGQPALLDTSTCKCTWAGSVEIKDAGQNVVSNGVQTSPKIETGTTPAAKTEAGQQSAGGDAGQITAVSGDDQASQGGKTGAAEAVAVNVNENREKPSNTTNLEPVTEKKLSCVKCSSDWTIDDINKIVPRTSREYVKKHIVGLNLAFRDYKINTCLRRIHFLAQVLHESGNLKYTKEGIGKGAPPSYSPFIGRGLIQLTLKENYEKYEKYVKEDFTSSLEAMEKLENSPHAAKSAGWFWHKFKNLNEHADNNDFIYITRIINGGFNGYDDRLKKLKWVFNEIYNGCNIKKEIDTNYQLKNSKTYNDERGTFAWGLWHDPDLDKEGCTKDKTKAIEGYERFLKISNGKDTGWYEISRIASLSFLKENGKLNVKKVAEYRLTELKKAGN
jgi:predicted chitinase